MNIAEARSRAKATDAIAEAIGIPFDEWAYRCHEISLRILRTGWLGEGRIARGFCRGVPGQHSWIVLGDDCYAPKALIADPVLWSYVPELPRKILVGRAGALSYEHVPHGAGSIWGYGPPRRGRGPVIELTPEEPLSRGARAFLEMLGPLDHRGWLALAHAPARGWPAGEIFAAMSDTEELSALVPIDVLGMVTRRNPGNLYF